MQTNNPWYVPVLSIFEKAVMTYVQAFLALVIAGYTTDFDPSTLTKLAIAALPALFTVLANGLPAIPEGLPFAGDLALRTLRTYVASFLGLLLASSQAQFSIDITTLQIALLGAVPAALAVVKALLAQHVGDSSTAALLPARLDVTSEVPY